jgi:predicted XRE-type DNA-binding protein
MQSPDIKPLRWVASSKKDLLTMPEEVQDTFGFALHLAQIGMKSDKAKVLKGFGSAGVLESCRGSARGHLPRGLHRETGGGRVRPTLLPEEIHQRLRDAQAGYGQDSGKAQGGRSSSTRTQIMMDIEQGSTNVYADLGHADADAMLVKAQLAVKIAGIVKRRRLTQAAVSEMVGLPQAKVSQMLRGQFRGISEDRMMRCLTALGQDVQIVVKPARKGRAGSLSVAA